MNIFINGQTFELAASSNIADALTLFLSEEQKQLSFAVALNQNFVAKGQYETVELTEQDSLDVLFPIQGG